MTIRNWNTTTKLLSILEDQVPEVESIVAIDDDSFSAPSSSVNQITCSHQSISHQITQSPSPHPSHPLASSWARNW